MLPCATFILAALVLHDWSPSKWPRPYVTSVLLWSVVTAYAEIMNLVCHRNVRVLDSLDALSVQTFVASAQTPVREVPVTPRVRWSRGAAWAIVLAACLWCVWRFDSHITVNPCVATGAFIVLGRRDALALLPVLGCAPVAWQMPNAWSLPACLRGAVAVTWLASSVATPPIWQCAVFALVGEACHPGLLLMGLVGRQLPRLLPVLCLCLSAM